MGFKLDIFCLLERAYRQHLWRPVALLHLGGQRGDAAHVRLQRAGNHLRQPPRQRLPRRRALLFAGARSSSQLLAPLVISDQAGMRAADVRSDTIHSAAANAPGSESIVRRREGLQAGFRLCQAFLAADGHMIGQTWYQRHLPHTLSKYAEFRT